jgi:hypothetical protein
MIIRDGPKWLNFLHLINIFASIFVLINTIEHVQNGCDTFWINTMLVSGLLLISTFFSTLICYLKDQRKIILIVTSIIAWVCAFNCFLLAITEGKN